jgi:hypothetical protein
MNKVLFVTEEVTEYSSKDLEGVGTLRWVDGQLYQWVENDGAVAARAGGPACYDVSANGGASTFMSKCLPDAADDDINFFAGIWMAAVPADYFGWILVLGRYADANIAVASGGASAIGDQLVPSTSTDTTGTGAARPYAFIPGIDISVANSASTVKDLTAVGYKILPHCVALEAITTGGSPATDTTPLTFDLFVRGLMAH